MLRQVASSAAQVRSAVQTCAETDLSAVAGPDRPRAIVVAGMGGSGIAGDVLAAACGTGSAVQIATSHGYQLPGWVGAADLVVAVSCSGSTEETLAAATEAVRRGCRLVGVGGGIAAGGDRRAGAGSLRAGGLGGHAALHAVGPVDPADRHRRAGRRPGRRRGRLRGRRGPAGAGRD